MIDWPLSSTHKLSFLKCLGFFIYFLRINNTFPGAVPGTSKYQNSKNDPQSSIITYNWYFEQCMVGDEKKISLRGSDWGGHCTGMKYRVSQFSVTMNN